MVVENYIDLLEENNSDAEEILIKMIEENFELDKSLKTSFINLIEEVYNQYPKAKYKGYAQEQE